MAVDDFAGARLVPVGGPGPEDLVVDGAGRMHTGVADGRVVRFDGADGAVETLAHVPGRPLPERLQPAPSPELGLVALTGVRELVWTLWLDSLNGESVATLPVPGGQSAGDVP